MGSQGKVGDLLRTQLRAERLRRNWSQLDVTNMITERYGINIYASSVAKIEAGDRTVFPEELFAFADLFGMSADALLGRSSSGTDVMWAASKLSTNAHKMVAELLGIQQHVADDVQDLAHYADRDKKSESVQSLIDAGNRSYAALIAARDALSALADEFPLPGRN
jgi:transcriptional regulator with XRE-family HTH domain